MASDRIYYLTQDMPGWSHADQVAMACAAGAQMIQLRSKLLAYEDIESAALQSRVHADASGARLIINDNPSIVLDSGADGVHLGQSDMPVGEARRILGGDMWIGGTANSFAEVKQLAEAGVDYIGLGPYRFTDTKRNLRPLLGMKGVRRIVKKMRQADIALPVYVIGGVGLNDVRDIIGTGVYGVAVASSVNKSADPERMLKDFIATAEAAVAAFQKPITH